jgi:Caspase domain
MSEIQKKTTVYALLIGINEYDPTIKLEGKAHFPALTGCVPDVMAIQEWLTQDTSIDLKPLVLTDKIATKSAIVAGFQQHLTQATEGDVVLIYYSGHGTMEVADTSVWTSETDGRLECMACYYDRSGVDTFLLADKELRYLLHQVWAKTQAHITAIFDCCNSGDNTRSMTPTLEKRVQRKIDFTFKQRDWSNFIFSDTLKPNDFKNKGLEDVLPSGRYIQFAAAESNEPAEEDPILHRGVFSLVLLDVLTNTGGFVSYRDLHSHIQCRLKYKYDQRPKLFAPADFADIKSEGFIGKSVEEKSSFAALSFNQAMRNYHINRGEMHGVVAGKTTVAVEFSKDKELVGRVTDVELDTATVDFDMESKKLLAQKPFNARLSGLSTRQLRIFLNNKDEMPRGTEGVPTPMIDRLLAAFFDKENKDFMTLVEQEKEADYTLVLSKGRLYLTKPNDVFRPLVAPVGDNAATNTNAVDALIRNIRHISQWQYLTDLENHSASALPKDALKIEVFVVEQDGSETLLQRSDTEGVTATLLQKPNTGAWFRKVRVTNQTQKDLYVGAFIQALDFGIPNYDLFSDKVVMFEKGESMWLRQESQRDPQLIPLQLEEAAYWYNWEKTTDIIKFIYSVDQFDASVFKMNPLTLPDTPTRSAPTLKGGIGSSPEEDVAIVQTWNALNVPIHVKNPSFNKVSLNDMNAMKNNVALAEFALGLYA